MELYSPLFLIHIKVFFKFIFCFSNLASLGADLVAQRTLLTSGEKGS